jgi:hypothetical protein
MAQTAANLVEHVLPSDVPLRQFVLTVPFELRTRLAYDKNLLGSVCRIFVDSVLGFYRRRMRDRGVRDGRSGAVTVVQRTSADLRLNPHLHTVALDGVFAPNEDGELVFHALPTLDNRDVADLLQVVRVRVLRMLAHAGVIEEADTETLCLLDDGFAERDPALFALAHSAVTGPRPAGPERRERVGALRTQRAATIYVALGSVVDVVAAGRNRTRSGTAHEAFAVRSARAIQPIIAGPALAATIEVGLVAVFDSIDAARGNALVRLTDLAQAIRGQQAGRPSAHAGQTPPPQSTSVSTSFLVPSVQLASWQMF